MKFPFHQHGVPRRRSHPARGAWIEMATSAQTAQTAASHPARGAWIEMAAALQTETANRVAPRKGCVD